MSPRAAAPLLALVALFLSVPVNGGASAAVLRWGGPGGASGALASPQALAVSGDRVLVADFDHDRVVVFTRDGGFLFGWGRTGPGPGEFRGPAGIAVGPDGAVYVADHYNHRVQRFTADGRPLGAWRAGPEDAAPCGIAVDHRGRVLVTDLEHGCVRSWSADGVPLAVWGTRGRGPGQLVEPWGIAVDASGEVMVADHGNDRVQRFTADGVHLGQWNSPDRLRGPMGIAVDREGLVHVTDLSGGVHSFTREGEPVRRGAEDGLEPAGPAPALALDHDGTIFLADPSRHTIARITGDAPAAAPAIPDQFTLTRIAHTPGPGPVTLHLAIPAPGRLSAEVYSLDGRRVSAIPASACQPGDARLVWDARARDGRAAPAGIYFARVRFEDGARQLTRTGRIVVLR